MSELENLEHDELGDEMADIVEEAETNDNGEVEEKKEGQEEEEATNETEDVEMDAVKVEPKEEPKADDTKDEPNGVSTAQ